jgi:hypothetical protein
MARRTKRKPPAGGLTVDQLRAHAAARKGTRLNPKHKAKISKGVMRSHAKRQGMTLSRYLKKKAK